MALSIAGGASSSSATASHGTLLPSFFQPGPPSSASRSRGQRPPPQPSALPTASLAAHAGISRTLAPSTSAHILPEDLLRSWPPHSLFSPCALLARPIVACGAVSPGGSAPHHLGRRARLRYGRHSAGVAALQRRRLQPPAASGAASAGGAGGPGLQAHSPVPSHPFNPRYHTQPRHQQGHQQAHHHSQHGQQQGSSGCGAWATPGPLSTGGAAAGGGASSSGLSGGRPSTSRYDTASSPSRPVVAPTTPSPPTLGAGEESRLLVGAVAAPAPSAAPSGGPMPVSAAARRAPRQQPSEPSPPLPSKPDNGALQLNPNLGIAPIVAAGSRQQPQGKQGGAAAGRRPLGASEAGPGEARAAQPRTQLERLYIRDFALVSEQTVLLGPGVNVITGESGSGKSVLVEAFSQVLGASAPQECIRAPAEMAVIEGTFLLGAEQQDVVMRLLESCGLPQYVLAGASTVDAGEPFRLTVRREISHAPAGGLRSRVYLNGAASSLRVLKELGALLVDTNGQHSSMSLRDPGTQLDLLDRIAGTSPLADSYGAALARLRQLEERLDELDELDDEEERRKMQKLVDAVAKLRVQPGEERELRRSLKKMEARRSAVEQCGLVRMALCGEGGAGGVTDALRTIEAQLNTILAQEEQNRTAAAKAKGKDHSKGADGEGGGGTVAGSAVGEDEAAGEEEDEEGEEGGAAAGAKMMEEALEQVAAAKDLLAAADGMVRSYARRYQFSQADHDATSERLARIERLMKQASAAGFGGSSSGGRGSARIASTEQLLEAAAECSSKLAAYYEMEGQREDWESQLESLVVEIRGLALQLSARRRAAAAALRSAVESCLRELAMGGSRFDVRIGWAEERPGGAAAAEGLYIGEQEAEEAGVAELGGGTYVMGPRGLDQVEFLLAAGPAEPLRPLAAVASGGESARVMLALKAAPAQAAAAAATAAAGASGPGAEAPTAAPAPMAGGGVPIMILDELDSGIGARLGSAVGSILARMSLPTHGSNSQIICVTHLPQVACYAAHHIKVQKEQKAQSPVTNQAEGAEDEVTHGAIPGAATPAGARVTTSFVPLASFEERCEEVAAMLGLDMSVAEEMLLSAQSQVAAMYPPGTAPPTLLQSPLPPASSRQTRHRGRGPAGSTTASGGGSGSLGNSARDSVMRVVKDSIRDGEGGPDDGRNPFMVVVSPAMDPNAGRIGSAGPAARREALAAAEDGEEEAELSAQLLAGVEAATLEHLARMEAHAKAVAAAAAAAAATAAAIGSPGGIEPVAAEGGTRQEVRGVGGAVAEAAAAVAAAQPNVAVVGAMPLEVADVGESSASETGQDSARDGGTAIGDVADATTAVPDAADPSRGLGAGISVAPAAGPHAAAVAAPVANAQTIEGRAEAFNEQTSTASNGFVVAVQPSLVPLPSRPPLSARAAVQARSPLPYNFGPYGGSGRDTAHDDDEDGDDGDQEDVHVPPPRGTVNTAMNAANVNHNGNGYINGNGLNGNGSAYGIAGEALMPVSSSHEDEEWLQQERQQQQQQQQQQEAWYEASSYVSSSSYSHGSLQDSSYTYNLGAAGGRFVVVPLGHENEFNEMFNSILSFSREEYEGEAMRSHEATLMQALQDAGFV